MTVYLVGAGPGDPGLITVRGLEVLRRAEVVVFDRLSAAELLEEAPPEAQRIDVGKDPAGHSTPQEDIHRLLVELGREGRRVVRLKGGDPFVFARGGEEAAALAAAGVAFEVVPGITSAIAVPAYAGIPATLRYSSTSLTIVTGHEDPTKAAASVDWGAIASVGGTIVILMGAARIAAIAEELQAGGLDPSTPVAAIRWGTRPNQHTLRSTLGEVGSAKIEAPSTIVVGEVAAQRLDWFERRPLFGLSVVNPRAREQASELTEMLTALGAAVLEVAAIRIDDPSDGGVALAEAAADVGRYEWVALTSPNGARRFCTAVGDGRRLAGVKLAAIGPGTAAVLTDHFLTVDLMAPSYVAESLVEAFPSGRGRVLLPLAAEARDILPQGLRAKGWDIVVVEAYRTGAETPSPQMLERVADADVVAFTASSTVTRFLEVAGQQRVPRAVAAIGPITAATAREAGLEVAIEPAEHSLGGLVDAIAAWAAHR